MRIRIDEAIEAYDKMHNTHISKKEFASLIMPDRESRTAQWYMKRMNDGSFGNKSSVDMTVIKNIIDLINVDANFIFDFSNP